MRTAHLLTNREGSSTAPLFIEPPSRHPPTCENITLPQASFAGDNYTWTWNICFNTLVI